VISLHKPNQHETLNWRRRAKHQSTPVHPLSAVDDDGDNNNDSFVRFFFSLWFLFSCISLIGKYWSAPVPLSLFDLFSIDEELADVTLQKKSKSRTTLQLTRNSSSISFWSSLKLTRKRTISEHLSFSMLAKNCCETC